MPCNEWYVKNEKYINRPTVEVAVEEELILARSETVIKK